MEQIGLSIFVLCFLIVALAAVILFTRDRLLPEKPVAITLNGTKTLDVNTGQKLLTALTNNGIMIPSVCAGAGTCGLCKVQIDDAQDSVSPVEMSKLSQAEIRSGMRLSCQVAVRTPLSITVSDAMINAESVECMVTASRSLTPLIREIVLQFPDGKYSEIIAGDYIQLEAPVYEIDFKDIDVPSEHEQVWAKLRGLHARNEEPTSRAYSISNRLEDTKAGRIVLNIRLALPPPSNAELPPGIVSSFLFNLAPGDRVKATGPFGSFRAQKTNNEMIFIGGGVGMAPLRAIINEQLELYKTTRKMSFWYGARSRAELFYVDEFEAFEKQHDNFRWTVSLSDPAPEDEWQGSVGFIHTAVLENYLSAHPAPEECEYYLCGPPLMIRSVRAMLDDLGVEPDNIFFDDFGV